MMKRYYTMLLLTSVLFFSCGLYDETAATINFWDFSNAMIKDWKDDPASFRAVDFSDDKLVEDLIKQYGTASSFARLAERNEESPRLLYGNPKDDYFGCQYYYKYYTEDNPLKSALGTWTGSVLYVAFSTPHPIVDLVAKDLGINTISCVLWADVSRENKSSPGNLTVRLDIGSSTQIILDGYAYFYPRKKEGAEVQYVNAANLEGMYMTGFDVAFSQSQDQTNKQTDKDKGASK